MILLCLLAQILFGQALEVAGLSFVAPPRPFDGNPMVEVASVNANWISVIPYAYTRLGQPFVHHDRHHGQWWGERPEGIRETIRLAHKEGIKVMLKPQVYIPGSWPGGLSFDAADDWSVWEKEYRDYIFTYIKIANELNVEAFCIGTEFRLSVQNRSEFWEDMIHEIRLSYNGHLTYAANWDDYEEVSFWDKLDIIGIDAYFPLSEATTPSVEELQVQWKHIMDKLSAFAEDNKKHILFSEFGYLSVDGAAGKNWELEKNINSRKVNELAQKNALEALLTTCSSYPCWVGGFLWKWFPAGKGHEGYPERDYTPQGKLAEDLVEKIYGMK